MKTFASVNKMAFTFSFFILSTFFMPIQNVHCEDFDNKPRLVVRGEGSVFKPSDQMEATIGVYTEAPTSAEALNENNKRMQQVVNSLKTLGLMESDYKTGRFTVKPIYAKTSGSKNEDDRTKVTSYEVVNSIHVKTDKINLAEKIISEAIAAGANQVRELNFNLSSPQAYQKEVITNAVDNAISNARSLAEAAGVKIEKPLLITLDQWQPIGRQYSNLTAKFSSDQDSSNLPIETGNVEIKAAVNMTFEIKS